MNATITNISTRQLFVPGPNLDLAPGAAGVWAEISVSDIDANVRLKELQREGRVAVSIADTDTSLAVATQGAMVDHALPRYTVANLPTGFNGRVAYATNGRSGVEGGGSGTGVPVVFTNGQWRRFEDMAIVAA